MVTMSKAKFDNMNAVANDRGVISAAAMDQRGSLQKAIGAGKGIDKSAVTDTMMEEFKNSVSKVLSPHASAMLLDPQWGLPASKLRASGCGLLLSYEESGYDQTGPGRLPTLLKGWDVEKLKAHGANCCKILLYYTPFDEQAINAKKHEWVARIGDECEAVGLPFFLEFVGYDEAGGDEKGLAFAKKKPEVVRGSMEEFNKAQYKVDVMKVEIPVNLQFAEGTKAFADKGTAYTKDEAVVHYQACAKASTKPFIYLSAGVSDAQFRESLQIANDAGITYNGILCGRATWAEGIPVYSKDGTDAFDHWLSDRGVQNIKALNAILDAGARPWWDAYGGRDNITVAT